MHEGRRQSCVRQVHRKRAFGEDAIGNSRGRPGECGTRRIDNDVEFLADQIHETARCTAERRTGGVRSLRSTVGDIDASTPFFLKSCRQTAAGTASPQDKHTSTGQGSAATLRHVVHKALTVGGVAQNTITVENERVDRFAFARTRRHLVTVLISVHLEGMRHVSALGRILAAKNRHTLNESARFEISSLVAHLDVKLRGKHLVDFWRQRVLNRMTDHKIFIHTTSRR